MATLNIRVVTEDGGRFRSEGECSERLAFAVWTLVRREPLTEPPSQSVNPKTDEFDRAAWALLQAAERYHAALSAAQSPKGKCQVAQVQP